MAEVDGLSSKLPTESFDNVLDSIGGFNLYQKWVFLLASVPNLIVGFYLLNPAFLLGIPDHRCKLPGYDNDTYDIQNDYQKWLINVTIPQMDDGTYDACHVNVIQNASKLEKHNSSILVSSTEIMKCSEWVYDKTVYERTFVTENNLVCDKTVWIANAEMMFYGGMLVGSVMSGVFSDIYGRKPVMYVSFLVMTVASFGLSLCRDYWLFVFVHFIQGASTIGSFMPIYIISLEITSTKKRMWPGIASNIPYVAGLVALATVAYFERRWNKLTLYIATPCVIMLPFWWLVPESPRWLLSKGRKEEAEFILSKAARWNGSILADKILDRVVIDEKPSWRYFIQVFKYRRMTLITVFTCFNWMVVSLSYYGLSLNMSNIAGNYYLNFALSGLVEAPSYLIVMLLVDKVGRRRLYCIVMLIGGLALGSTFFTLKYGQEGGLYDGMILALTLVGKCGVTAGFSIQYLYTAELFPTIIRSAGLGVASLSARIGTMICPYIVILGRQLGGVIGKSFALIIIGILSILSTLVSVSLPETVNRQLPETIQDAERLEKYGQINT